MRARYYEPGTGRFTSEDPVGHGWNWFINCSNSPTNAVDSDGRITDFQSAMAAFGMLLLCGAILLSAFGNDKLALGAAHIGMIMFAAALEGCDSVYNAYYGPNGSKILAVLSEASFVALTVLILEGTKNAARDAYGPSFIAVMVLGAYALAILGALADQQAWEESEG